MVFREVSIAEHTVKHGNPGTIGLRSQILNDSVVIEIEDNGGGIPESIREKIFDPFFTTKGVGKGTGQGLSIARSIIEDGHGGTLTFSVENGIGTTFSITLPLHQLR